MPGFMSGASVADGTITSAKLADNAVTLAKMAGGTDGNLIGIDASGDPAYIATGDDGQVLTSGGTGVAALMEAAAGGGFTVGTDTATTSGTSIALTGIPADTTMVTINFEGVSLSSNVSMDILIGDSGGIETTGYISNIISPDGTVIESTAAWETVTGAQGTGETHGSIVLTLKDSSNNTWIAHGVARQHTGAAVWMMAGSKSLSAAITQVQLSGGTFDAGSASITYI